MTLSSPPLSPSSSGPRVRPWLVALGALAVVLLAAVVALALVVRSHRADRSALEDARGTALLAGRQLILNLDAISAPTVDADLARVVAGATGDFAASFGKSQDELKKFVVGNATSSSGTILAAGVVSADTDSATVLVAVDRRVKDKTNPDGVVAHDRWQLSLEKHGGRWLVSDLQPVS